MPGQRRTAGSRARGSRLPRLAGLGVAVIVAVGLVTGYLLAFHPAIAHHAPPLPTRVVSYQTVGLVVADTQPGSSADQLLQLLGSRGTPQFSPLAQTQLAEGSPQWTADLMAGGSYIFIYLPTGQCLSATGKTSQPKLALRHCDLDESQRWHRTLPAVLTQAHDFYEYANLGDGSCLTQTGVLPGQIYSASLTECLGSQPADQLIAFWWSSV
jgi:hypothetical protein